MRVFFGCVIVLSIAAMAPAEDVGFRIRFGLKDEGIRKWDGTVAVSGGGKVTRIDGWRFEQQDHVDGTTGWEASTRVFTGERKGNQKGKQAAAKKAGKKGAAANPAGPMGDNGVVLSLSGVSDDSEIKIETKQGSFAFKVRDIPFGDIKDELKGAVEIERTASSEQLTSERTDDDFPAVAADKTGNVHVAWVSFTPGLDRDERAKSFSEEPKDLSYLNKPTGGDRVWVRTRSKSGQWGEAIAVTDGGGDVYKCATAVDGSGKLWVFWADQKDGNFDIYGRAIEGGKAGAVERLSSDKGSDVCPVACTDTSGQVWVAWMGARGNVFRIISRHQNGSGWSDETIVSTQKRSCWSPSIAASMTGGRVGIAWDTYDKGDYDVWVREFDSGGKADDARAVTNSPDYEARPTTAYDHDGRLWVAWEQSGPTWGKDWGALVQGKAIPLYSDRQIGMRVLDHGQWVETSDSWINALPGRSKSAAKRKRVNAVPVPPLEVGGETRKQAQEAETAKGVPYNNISRMVADSDGRMWLLCRSRLADFRSALGSIWVEHASYFDGEKWNGPIMIPNSDDLLYNVPAVAADPNGGLFIAHSSDHRQTRHVVKIGNGPGGNASLDSGKDPFDNDIFVGHISGAGKVSSGGFKPAAAVGSEGASPATIKEVSEVDRARAQRISYDGGDLRLLRGEFHRHTEISGDGGNDGPLEDMWRYAVDVAAMDWLGCGDHDNGGGREYTWWLTQKTTDAFHLPGSFDPLFTYERSVRYPEGHRNVIFPYRGVRTLPRLPISDRNAPGHAPDTQMLYKYLHLFGGICAEHTSATSMGTDWRDNDPVVEPFVEIYQGCRQNYERPGAPRCPSENDAIGGWEPKGFINLALLKGYRLAFESSSDHRSTHISYALIYAKDATREAIVEGMRARHSYAATDNIVAEFRCKAGGKDYMLGDEFTTDTAPELRVKLHGTGPFAKVVVIKDDVEIHTITPGKDVVEFTWTDPKPTPGKTSYYYVRGEQADGELVWVSPMWIKYQGK